MNAMEANDDPQAMLPKPMLPRDSYVAQYPRGAGRTNSPAAAPTKSPQMAPRTLDDQQATAAADHNWSRDDDDRDDLPDMASGRRSPGEHQYYDVKQPADQHSANARAAAPGPVDEEPEMSAVQTMEIDSGDEDDELAPASAPVWEAPSLPLPHAPRDLAEMLSSDEEKEDDDLPRQSTARGRTCCAPALCAAPAPLEEQRSALPSAEASAELSAAASSPSPRSGKEGAPSLPDAAVGPMSWLSALPDSAYGAESLANTGTPPRAAKADVAVAGANEATADLAMSDSSSGSSGAAPYKSDASALLTSPSPPGAAVTVGSGIIA